MKRFLLRFFQILLVLFLLFAIYAFWQLADRHPGYHVDLFIHGGEPAPLLAGFAAIPITPSLPDTWQDTNQDAVYSDTDGDTFQDNNNNGRFDAIWMAGFHKQRPAQGVHDHLWARAMIIDDGRTRLALVVLDLIGLGGDDIIDIRKSLPAEWGIDYTIISSTHTHEGPDVIGMWGANDYHSGVNQAYLQQIKAKSKAAIQLAVEGLRPAKFRFAKDLQSTQSLVGDSRPPLVGDPGLYLMQAIDLATGQTLGSLCSWSNHPETLWDKNLQISSDFPHYYREGIEQGVKGQTGLGGLSIYAPGSLGGLMTTTPAMGIPALSNDTIYRTPSFDKIKAQGQQLAYRSLQALAMDSLTELSESSIRLRAKSITLPLKNPLYRLGALVGILDRGLTGWMKIRSEVAIWQLGPATFLHQPGEIYPEIINGGIESPEGQDFAIAPQEVPAIRPELPGDFKFILGLSNDMIGYIIPKSQWDQEAPFTYQSPKKLYGETNSLGPETAPIIHRELFSIIKDLRTNLPKGK